MSEWLLAVVMVSQAAVVILSSLLYLRKIKVVQCREIDQARQRIEEWRVAAFQHYEIQTRLADKLIEMKRELEDLRATQQQKAPRRAVAIGSIAGPTPVRHEEERAHGISK